jgi:FixJ family two-component response regulator
MIDAPPPLPVVHLVDDDPAVLRALARLIDAAGYRCVAHPDAEAFLAQHDPAEPGCAVVDLGLPGMDGFGVQASLATGATARPVVFLTGAGDIPASVRAMKAGAVDFLTKPVEPAALLAAVAEALRHDAQARAARDAGAEIVRRLATLTPRERQVLDRVVAGRLNKQIAADLGSAEKTVKIHRSRVMRKLGARTVADLIRMVTTLRPA